MDRDSSFTWDPAKELENIYKYGVDFITVAKVFKDPERKIFIDAKHSKREERLFCIGKVKNRILTVRFTYREGKMRIIGAGCWRKGKRFYEKEKNRF